MNVLPFLGHSHFGQVLPSILGCNWMTWYKYLCFTFVHHIAQNNQELQFIWIWGCNEVVEEDGIDRCSSVSFSIC
jgi:hypothetical protein